MSKESLANVGLAYRWLLAYYREVALFCSRVREEFELQPGDYVAHPDSAGIQVRSSKALRHPHLWLPGYHYQFFYSSIEQNPAVEVEQGTLCAVCIDHYDAEVPTREEPVIYLARFGPLLGEELKELAGLIVYHWVTGEDETERDGWHFGTFRRWNYSYRTLPLSAIENLDQVGSKVVQPLIDHDVAQRSS